MLKVLGLIFVAIGLISILWGDKKIGGGGGAIQNAFSSNPRTVKYMRIPFGLAMIYAGVQFIRSHG